MMGTSTYKDSAKGEIYHIYNRGNHKKNIFLDNDDFSFYLLRLKTYSKENNFSILAYCLMPNHIHLLLKQNSTQCPQKLMASLHTSYSKFFNKKYSQVGHLFQGRYKQKTLGSNEYASYLIGYIHLNPIKANLCSEPQAYTWSSYKEYLETTTNNSMCDHQLIQELGLFFDLSSSSVVISVLNKISPKEAFDDPQD